MDPYHSLAIQIGRYPRAELLSGPTPLRRLRRLEAALGSSSKGARLYAKRDDLSGSGCGGSKLRKLEFLLGEAMAVGADTVLASGLLQSNSATLAAAATASLGLRCELALRPLINTADYRVNGNMLLDDLFGAPALVLPDATAVTEHFARRTEALEAEGHKTYLMPPGASSAVASLGYVAAAVEIARQEQTQGLRFDRVVLANGSSGTQAGLVAGFALMRRRIAVQGFAVFAELAATRATTLALAREAIGLLGGGVELGEQDILVTGEQRGAGYGRTTPEALAAIRLMAQHEGLLLDPVYSGKAFAGLLELARHGDFRSGENVLFLMTGGAPALFGYRANFS